ncbi:S1 RNA-binding domain-containing protein [Parafrankia sp. BMG5.11]|uniref:S1 RNA-binding domain-containing protein n=1 Tax=Parafrankia sp. BMG5.11 TaxID=222540 RepID=UPI00103A740F|nr:S1 RNA-binding domain-containing protein [Parafrankia sp. BMG5.11]TCJ33732.1 S1 RNA-binding domain-containing protein [Parafrankia sp. BMG5.11]
MTIKLMRDSRPEPNTAFFATQFGIKELRNGQTFDFDVFTTSVIAPTCAGAGLTLLRADQVYGRGDLTDTAWHGLQVAQLVLVDFSGRSANVAAEFALALALGKQIIVLVQDPDDIPSDVRGHFRYIQYGSDWQSIERLKAELGKELPAALARKSTEMILVPMHPGAATPVPGEVVIADKDFVMVLTDDRRRVVLNAADVDPRRIIPDMAKRFPVGTRVTGSFEVDLTGDTRYTLIPGQANPWSALEAEFPPGTEFRSRVDSVIPGLGVFVHVAHGVNGLVPAHKLNGRQVGVGDTVEAAVTTFDAERRRIGLRLDRVLHVVPERQPGPKVTQPAPRHTPDAGSLGGRRAALPASRLDAVSLPAVGATLRGEVVRVVQESDGSGGFILLRVEGLARPVLLHHTAMTEDLRADLAGGFVEMGEEMAIEIVKVDALANKVLVRDLPEIDSKPLDEWARDQAGHGLAAAG